MIISELLAVLAISAATGLRLALPLLLIGLFSGDQLWSAVPILADIPQVLVITVLVIWSLLELTISKDRVSRRFLQSAELFISPFVGTIAGVAIARLADISESLILVLLASTGGVLALVIQMVQVGWLYRFNSPPIWVIFLEDALCVCLVFFAFDAPEQGGLIALFLLWLAIRSSAIWREWQQKR
ncbi:hypothetical protein N836_17295 [Leptolyngbya sp. Heron Island J]|uniref:DUF4126 domain-containing protein n=1 Tax=Leptolyngbya sp. Heron Island J TaxID=1385935 RepID=UPI0003B9A80C|nr:DUF4126 domain-containing protein [Leptolyngbya sp. Heron Island J]ESA34380.1 hypothetical protein N836_17295 [Leptolyngbya sp. Heron Island J]